MNITDQYLQIRKKARKEARKDLLRNIAFLVYATESVPAAVKKTLFMSAAMDLKMKGLVKLEEIQEYEEKLTPNFTTHEGQTNCVLTLPNGYNFLIRDTAKEKAESGETIGFIRTAYDGYLHEENANLFYFTAADREKVKEFIYLDQEIDEVSKIIFMKFVNKIFDRYE